MTARTVLVSALAVVAMLAAPNPTRADTYESYHCHCSLDQEIPVGDQVVKISGTSCSCYYDYTLGKSGTKEFRGYCDGDLSESVYVDQRDSGTTCTIQTLSFGGYVSKSCTNWNPFGTDQVRVQVKCEPNNEGQKHNY